MRVKGPDYGDGPDGLPVGRLPLLDDLAAGEAARRVGINPAHLDQRIWRVLLRRPKLAQAVYDVLTDLLFRNRLDVRIREMLIMRIGWSTASVFEWSQHWKIAALAGVDANDILAVRYIGHPDGLDESTAAALGAVDDIVSGGAIRKETWTALQSHFDDDELLEVTAIAATWTWISAMLRSLDVPLDEGMGPWPPDGVGPDAYE